MFFNKSESEGNASVLKTMGLLLGLFIVFLLAYNMFTFRVYETDQAVITRFGEVKKVIVGGNDKEVKEANENNPKLKNVDVVSGKGIHFKMPFVDDIEYFSDRLLTYDTDQREVTTLDKKKVVLDNYAQWKITNPALFKVTMKNARNAHVRLDDLIYSNLNKEIGRTSASDIISNMQVGEEMLTKVKKDVNEDLINYGMAVVDVRIKRTELPLENYQNIYKRMETERQSQAKKYRSEGAEEAQKIRSSSDKEATIIEANAYEEAEKIKGEGDSEALKIYASAYNKDPEFYKFYRTLEAYKKTMDDKTKLVIPSDSEFTKYLFKE